MSNESAVYKLRSVRNDEGEVWIADGGWDALAAWVAERDGVVWMIHDQAVDHVAERVHQALKAHGVHVLGRRAVKVTEAVKSLHSLSGLYTAMAEAQITRDAWVLAVGGGVLTDLGGYAAASYLRGVRWIAVPTTLLAQVDAGIGGKVAVNLAEGKNLVGAFHLPRLVYINPDVLSTLPLREWQTGLGEIVKSALIEGGPLWRRLSQAVPAIGEMSDQWRWIIARTAEIKIDIVNRDLEEHGDRMFLNFGHTLAHAVEQIAGYGQFSHGQAVAMGSRLALYLSEKRLGLDPRVRLTVEGWLARWGLAIALPELGYDTLEPVLLRDKKARQFGLQWVLLQAPGKPRVVDDVPAGLVAEGLRLLAEHHPA